jgi:hypothetical protein
MATESATPAIEEVLADLRLLRERGLVRIRHADLATLNWAAAHATAPGAAGGGPRAVEALLRAAVDNLGGGTLSAAATASFGLGRGERDRAAQDRRRRAAVVYGVSVDRFRKHHERVVLEQVAEEILKISGDHAPEASAPGGRPEVLQTEPGRRLTFAATIGALRFQIVVHTGPVELLAGVDILVVPQNVYFEMPQHFKSSVSAAVRRSAARRGDYGEIAADVVRDELHDWLRRYGRPGLPVAPGMVAPTSSGEMAGQGIRRLYHAAIAAPRPGTNDYDVEPAVIVQAARNVLATARRERTELDLPLRSVCFPLLGAGRGGLSPAVSFAWLWTALERELRENGAWDVHFITRDRVTADLIVSGLADAQVIPRLAEQGR